MAPSGISDPRWYVVHTKPKQEARAEANLRSWGLDTLYPRLRGRRSSTTLGAHSGTPLFPRYLFARFDAAGLLAKVRLTRGVHDVVALGGCATPVDDEIVALVRGRMEDDGFVRVPGPRPGDVVQIAEGPLRSLVGIFEREMDSRGRVMLLLTSMGCQARIHIAKASIRKAPAASVA
jgi:transcriptional antiterminator RfaH